MSESTKDKVEGKLNEAVGVVKEKVGHATNNPNLETEGQADQVDGKVQNKVGDIKKVFNK